MVIGETKDRNRCLWTKHKYYKMALKLNKTTFVSVHFTRMHGNLALHLQFI
jgi:hypothetical protein